MFMNPRSPLQSLVSLLDRLQSTMSRDIKVLKELSQQFVYDLAKSDLAYHYKQCIDEIEEEEADIYSKNIIT